MCVCEAFSSRLLLEVLMCAAGNLALADWVVCSFVRLFVGLQCDEEIDVVSLILLLNTGSDPDTTRPRKPHEKDGVEYHFVTKQQFDADALNNK